MTNARTRMPTVSERATDRIDLVIDLMTLGQYGLERVHTDDAGARECSPRRADWEAPGTRRRGGCDWRSAAPSWVTGACA